MCKLKPSQAIVPAFQLQFKPSQAIVPAFQLQFKPSQPSGQPFQQRIFEFYQPFLGPPRLASFCHQFLHDFVLVISFRKRHIHMSSRRPVQWTPTWRSQTELSGVLSASPETCTVDGIHKNRNTFRVQVVPIRVEPQVFVDILAPWPPWLISKAATRCLVLRSGETASVQPGGKVFLRYFVICALDAMLGGPCLNWNKEVFHAVVCRSTYRDKFIWKLALPVFLRPFACNCPDLACRVILVGHPCEKAWHAEVSSWLKLQKETSKVSKRSSLYFWHSPPNYLDGLCLG